MREDGPRVYRCTQGVLYVKRSENAAHPQVVALKRPLGTYVYSTGWLWTGPSGGTWAEFDASKGEMGWVLVQGPGFGLRGPALIDVNDQALQGVACLTVRNMGKTAGTSEVLYEALIDTASTVASVKKLLCDATGLKPEFCCLVHQALFRLEDTAGKEYLLPPSCMQPLDSQLKLSSLAVGGDILLHLVYTGNVQEDCRPGVLPPSFRFESEEDDRVSHTSEDQSDDMPSSASGMREEIDLNSSSHVAGTRSPVHCKLGGYNKIIERADNSYYPDDYENRLDFENYNMDPEIIPPKILYPSGLSPRTSALYMQGRSHPKSFEDSRTLGLGELSSQGWPNMPRPSESHRYASSFDEAGFPNSAWDDNDDYDDLNLPPEDYDDDEVQFGPSVDPMDMPDFGYGNEIEWIDAD